MKILCVGDVVGQEAVAYLERNLWKFRRERGIDMAIVNGENAAIGNGIDSQSAERLIKAGADVLTSGNHVWQKKEIREYLATHEELLRPANYPPICPGCGDNVYIAANGYRILVMNLMGTVYLEPLADPFYTVDRILRRREGQYDIALLDFHAEATSEKLAMGWYLDGRISAMWGTHTHVQTADAKVLPKGTGYVTDLGMTGSECSVLGVKTECIIERFTTHMPVRFEHAEGQITAHGVLFEIDEGSGRTQSCQNVVF